MTIRYAGELDDYYASIESRWAVSAEDQFAGLVIPNGNGGAPVHRWFRMKEAYSCGLVASVLDAIGFTGRSVVVCDPFCGSGTTGVSVADAVREEQLERATFVGLESNPFLHLVSRSKIDAMHAAPKDFSALAQRVGATVARRAVEPAPMPELSTFSEARYFKPEILTELLRLRAAIEREMMAGVERRAIDLARVCLGAIVENVSKLRRDGRALRYEPDKPTVRPVDAFLHRAGLVEDDLSRSSTSFSSAVHHVDARAAAHTLRSLGPFDLVLFSPPYPNNIDYTEVYKLEAWLLGFYVDQPSFRAQRWQTVRSHASLDFGDSPIALCGSAVQAADTLVEPLLTVAAGRSRYASARQRTIKGYAYDMLATLTNLACATEPGARLVYVVGNSLHGGRDGESVLIAADVLIARLAELAGFTIDRIMVARVPSRRRTASPFLRESIVFATRASEVQARG